MKRIVRVVCALTVVGLAACGRGAVPTAPSPPRIFVAGAYDIRKTVISDTCGISAPGSSFSNPGEVRHSAGATTFVLNDHGSRDLPGTLSPDGTFTIAPTRALVMGTINAVGTWDGGRFTTAGFDVRETTDLETSPMDGGPPCRVVTAWAAARQGGQNTIP